MKDDDFCLKDKRKELFEDLLKQFKNTKDIERILFVILNCVDDQDKEFVRRLKEGLIKEINEDKIHLEESLKEKNYSEATLTDNIIYANECLVEKIDKLVGEI